MADLSISQAWLNSLGGSAITENVETYEEEEYYNIQKQFEAEGRDCDDFSWAYYGLVEEEVISEEEMNRYIYCV